MAFQVGPGGKVFTRILLILSLMLLWFTCEPAFSESFTGRCDEVIDGDTILVFCQGQSGDVEVRLEGVDCPEKGQPFGTRAKKFTAGMVLSQNVTVNIVTHDRYKRTVARVIVKGKDLSLELVKAGLAWHYRHYSKDPELARAEEDARAKKLGLWAMADAEAPWDYRHQKVTIRGYEEIDDFVSAVRENNLSKLKELLTFNPEMVNEKDRNGKTLLQSASVQGNQKAAELLIAKGADVKAADSRGWTALHYAASYGQKGLVLLLISKGAKVNQKDTKSGKTPLHWAASRGAAEVVEVLLSKGADSAIRDREGRTPLGCALRSRKKDAAEILRKYGARE
ncbi:MAG: thermonuclease family protein [Candidatus Eremiobacteraeota bacterium]|nr:thermonuclease family protein [Candidatus Eremiobacteraeota bacterium]